jgi:hypothetical protein
MTQATYQTTAFVPDGLIAQNAHLLVDEPITLISGQNLLRGAVLGKITASGKYTLSASAAVDGSQTPAAVLAVDTNAAAADKATVAYFRGDFQASAVTLGAGHTLASVKPTLRTANIELISTQGGV